MARTLLLAAIAAAVCVAVFVYGVVVGAKKYPPYRAMRAAKRFVLGTSDNTGQQGNRNDERHGQEDGTDPLYRETEPKRLIALSNSHDVEEKRAAVVGLLWGSKVLPFGKLPRIDIGIRDDRYKDSPNLRRIDRLTVEMDFGLTSVCYHFVPRRNNGHLVVYHQGHCGDFFLGKIVIEQLLENGYAVIGIAMPLKGMNSQPVVHLERFGALKIDTHDEMEYLAGEMGHPIRYFIEPVVVVLNHATRQGRAHIAMVGLSGGGWTTVVSAAVDTRIDRSYSVAGSLPMYLRPGGNDYEQTALDFYTLANYLELYVLASIGDEGRPRRHIQILNRYDPTCFSGVGYRTYEQQVIEAVRMCGEGEGTFQVVLDETHREHKISEWALSRILSDLAEIE